MREHSSTNTKRETLSKVRLEAFSDGVIAIIITLIILDVKVPKFDNSTSSAETWRHLSLMLPNLMSYILSFVALGIYWVNHHNFLHIIKHTDSKFLWYNLHLLFWLSLIPMPTAFLAAHPCKPEATAMYGLIMVTCAAAFTLMSRYSENNGLFIEHLSARVLKKVARMNVFGIALYFISIFAGYLSVYISYGIFVLIPALYFLPHKIEFE